jgi:thioredoxin 1
MTIESGTASIFTYIISGLLLAYLLYNFIIARRRLNKPPSDNVKMLTDANFESTIGKGVSLVDFWAPWCGPCRVQGPIVDEVADEMVSKASVCKLNVDENPLTARKYGIQSIPTILIFRDGKPVQKFVGIKNKNTLINSLGEL